jgi:hypothetical protein
VVTISIQGQLAKATAEKFVGNRSVFPCEDTVFFRKDSCRGLTPLQHLCLICICGQGLLREDFYLYLQEKRGLEERKPEGVKQT